LVSVLFVDLVGFTSLSESREAEDVRELLARYFDAARTIVGRHGGATEKFIGDAVMAVWGAPVAREDDAERAVRAALELLDAVGVLGQELGNQGLQAHAGVVSGQVAALESSNEGMVVGDRVNTASRVQAAAPPGTVLVDDATRRLTSAAIAYQDFGEHLVKGKAEPLRLWRATRVVAGRGGAERAEGLEAPFVGRDGDLRLLKELFHGALDRRSARLVAVTAEAGAGKSRLRREFSNYVDGLAQTVLWHSGRCPSYGDGVAYWALAEMVRQRFGIAEDAKVQEASARLAAGLERWVAAPADREFLEPRLGALLGVAEPRMAREELFAGWRLFFERLAEHEAVVLAFEDLQWADVGLLDFIEQLLDWSAASPIFILTLARPELRARREGWPAGRRAATMLALEPLDDGAMRALLAGLVDGLSEDAAGLIVTQAQGVPLYAIEIVRALSDRGVLVERDGRLSLDGELGELDVPASLGSLLAARLDALEPAERRFVKAMSVFGGAFSRSTAAALGQLGEEQLDGVLESLVRKQVLAISADPLSPDRGQYAFAQGMLRTVAYEMLSRQERKPRHRAAAEHLRRVFPDDGEDVAEVIASHYLDAYRAAREDPDAEMLRLEAVAALRRAAQRAAIVGAPEVAERSYRTAIELALEDAERAELTQAAGQMALQSGRLSVALELLERASASHLAAGREREAAQIAGLIGRALVRLGRIEDAVGRITAALAVLAQDSLDPEVGALNAILGRSLVFAGDYQRAAQPLETALEIAQALKLPAVLSDALTTKGILYLQTGRAEEARYLLAGAIDVAERHDLPDALARAQHNSGNLGTHWDLPEAEQHFESAISLARRRGDRDLESVSAAELMAVQLYTGRWQEAESLGVELLADNAQRPGAEDLHSALAILYVMRGELDAARASLERLAPWTQSDDDEFRALYAGVAVAVRLAEGSAEEALELGQSSLPHAVQALGPSNEAVRTAWPATLEAALRLGRLEEAHRLVMLLTEQPPGHIPPYLTAQLARGRALIFAAEGQHDGVEAELVASIATLGELGYRYWLAVAQTDLAEWLIAQEGTAAAAALLEEAITIFQSLGAAPALARARELTRTLTSATVA
jgi:class 3 adenylate cyclase/tetratricopeptide (TPR) repeat protein